MVLKIHIIGRYLYLKVFRDSGGCTMLLNLQKEGLDRWESLNIPNFGIGVSNDKIRLDENEI